jgi:hypothetical protein
MDEPDDTGRARLWRWARIVVLSLATLFLVGVLAGFVAGTVERGRDFGMRQVSMIAGLALAAMLCGWLLLRAARRPAGEAPLTRRERLNRNILIGSGALGFAMAMVTILFGSDPDERASVFSSGPLPMGVALIMVLVIGLLVPAMSIFWHRRVVDEQEADAYKTAALYGLYVYMIGTPVWWFAWRGGFAPAPDGMLIFFVTIATVGVIWTWKKYR